MQKVYYTVLFLIGSLSHLYSQTCQPSYTALPFSENFESSWQSLCGSMRGFPSQYWLNEPTSGNNSWRREDDGASANWYGPGSGQYLSGANRTSHSAMFHTFAANDNSTGSLSLYINCSTGFSTKELNFYYFNLQGDDTLFIDLSIDGGTTYTPLKSLGETGYGWVPENIPFISLSPNTIIRFKGKRTTYNSSDIQFDEVSVASAPCYTPAVKAEPLVNGADLFFTPSSGGSPDGYEYAVTTSAVPPSSGTFTSSRKASITGLESSVTYYAYVRSVCTGTGNSNWVSQSFQTAIPNCTPQYAYSRSFDFTLKGENNTLIRKSGYTTSTYHDYTSSSNVILTKGKSYGAIVNLSDTIISFNCWIDFNDDGAFTYNEKVINDFRWRLQTYLPLTLYIPLTAQAGTHRLRLRTNSTDQCASYFAGQSHDYTVTIVEANADAGYDVSQGIVNSCVNGGNMMINTESNNNNTWIPLTDTSNNIIASINANGNDLGRVNVYEYINSGTIRQNNSKPYLDRNTQISVENQPATNVSIRLYFLKTEYDALTAADPAINSLNDLWMTKTSQPCGSIIGQGLLMQPVGSGVSGNGYYVEYSIPGFSSFYLHSNSSVLPITISSLRSKRENNSNHLLWTTATEENNLGFDLEMSADGAYFKKIAFIESKAVNGNSSATLSYSYDDSKAYPTNIFYRLKQIHKDGKLFYSNVVITKSSPSGLQITSLFPNPVSRDLTLQLYSVVNEKVSIIVTTIAGKSILNKTLSLRTSNNNIKLNTSSLPAGTYLLKAVGLTTGVQSISKFVKM